METSLQTLQRQVEKETAHGLSWDTVVQLRTLQALTEVNLALGQLNRDLVKWSELNTTASKEASSRLDQLSKVLAEILSDVRAKDGITASGASERSGGIEEPRYSSVHPSPEPSNGKGRRGRPRKTGRQSETPIE